jgi:type IV pilus assembly protein PilV
MSAAAPTLPTRQSGVMLLEALVGILIFTIGLIGLLGMQATASQATSEMKHRSEAVLLAEELMSQMWADNHLTLQTNYAGGGTKYSDWFLNRVVLNTTITSHHPTATGLPGVTASANKPVVTVVQGVAPDPVVVTITMYWQEPKDPAPHKYVSVTSLPSL